MEVLVATETGKIIDVKQNNAPWGIMEDYNLYIESMRDPEKWHGRLCLIKIPDMSYIEGESFKGGNISLDWIVAHSPTETLFSWEFDMIAEIKNGY